MYRVNYLLRKFKPRTYNYKKYTTHNTPNGGGNDDTLYIAAIVGFWFVFINNKSNSDPPAYTW